MQLPAITIIGAGNVGWHMAKAFYDAGFQVNEVYSRNIETAIQSSGRIPDCKAVDDLDFSQSHSTFFVLCVPDDAIPAVTGQLLIPDEAVVVHTSGSATIDLLNGFKHFGVLYPLQTFSRSRSVDFSAIPMLTEANDDYAGRQIAIAAQRLSGRMSVLTSEQRKKIHLAAVFANNFINHLLSITESILEQEGTSFSMLESLIKETINKAFASGALLSQTGPAVRNDMGTIAAHLDLLSDNKHAEKIYRTMTESILSSYGNTSAFF
mgnify:CR=1 FL=1